jgi:NAD(P)-dependent dehydrogenase (short-subunit alcohol dehydrogenase family)
VQAVADDITARGGTAHAAQVDALDEQAVERHAADVAARAGRIDILFNAIGMEDVQGTPLLQMPLGGSGTMLGRLPTLAEVASAATLLASDRASAMTATIANITCGGFADL